MIIGRIQSTSFGITTNKYNRVYAENCWNEITEGKYKDYTFMLYNNYENGKKGPSLIILRKLGLWLKSKVKYRDRDNNIRTIFYNL